MKGFLLRMEDFSSEDIRAIELLSPLDMIAALALREIENYRFNNRSSSPPSSSSYLERYTPIDVKARDTRTPVMKEPRLTFKASNSKPLISHDRPHIKQEKPKKLKFTIPIGDNVPSLCSTVQPDLPELFKRKIDELGGSIYEPELMIQKALKVTDKNASQSRLSMPEKQLTHEPKLTDYERLEVERRGNNNEVIGLKVRVIDPRLEISVVTLKKWKATSVNSYVFCKTWNSLARDNSLKVDDYIQVWSFRLRQNDELCFAIVKLN